MYEVGKIADEQMDDFINELGKVDESLITEVISFRKDYLLFMRSSFKSIVDCPIGGENHVL